MASLFAQAGKSGSTRSTVLRACLPVLVGTALLALSAHVQVPFWPVRLSMQTFVVVMLGLAYGPALATATVLAYVAQGAAGLPVFQGGAGPVYIVGPTGGYLLGFVAAVQVAGRASTRGFCGAFSAVTLATAAIYVPGVAWLAVLFGFEKAVAFGLRPFVGGELLKMLLAVALAPLAARVRDRIGG